MVELLVPRRFTGEDGGVSPSAHFLPKEMKRDLALLTKEEIQISGQPLTQL